jgi:hypothetical protein
MSSVDGQHLRHERFQSRAEQVYLFELPHVPEKLHVQHLRRRLREIWERSAPSQEALLKSLQDWCQQAEATGIQALETFSRNLRGFSLPAH